MLVSYLLIAYIPKANAIAIGLSSRKVTFHVLMRIRTLRKEFLCGLECSRKISRNDVTSPEVPAITTKRYSLAEELDVLNELGSIMVTKSLQFLENAVKFPSYITYMYAIQQGYHIWHNGSSVINHKTLLAIVVDIGDVNLGCTKHDKPRSSSSTSHRSRLKYEVAIL